MEGTAIRYRVERNAHTEKEFQDELAVTGIDEPSAIDKMKAKAKKSCACSKDCVLSFFSGLFPIFTWIRQYEKRWIGGDIVSGITVGVVHIPQSMAFSILAGLAPVFGLYTSFYPVLIYTLMGTSRHISVGTFAVTSLLARAVVFRYYPPEEISDVVDVNPTTTDFMTTTGDAATSAIMMNDTATDARFTELDLKRAGVACAVTFLMGLFQLIFGMLKLGFITSYMSEPLIQGFTTGAAFQVVTSQTPPALGLKLKSFNGPVALIYTWIEILKNIPNIHVATLIITIVCIIILTVGREINIRYKQKMKLPLPTEVILVIIAILASHFGQFKNNFGVNVVDNVPTGLPAPRMPDWSIMGSIVADGFALAVVGFSISVSLSKMYGIRHGYSIDSTQELLAYGVSNLIPSFFLCFPNAAALARCEIQDNTGGNTQVVGIISVVIVLIVVLVLGPVFEPLPRSVLACIIIVGLFGIIAQLRNLKPVYKTSKIDFAVWLVTFLATVVLGVDLGLLTGIAFAMITVIVRTQVPRFEILSNIADTELYRATGKYHKQSGLTGILIVKMHNSLYYVNKDYFKGKLLKAVGFDPGDILTKRKQEKEKREKEEAKRNKEPTGCCGRKKRADSRDEQTTSSKQRNESTIELANVSTAGECKSDIHTIIIDCSSYGFIDFVGGKVLKSLAQQFDQLDVKFLLASCNEDVRGQLKRSGFMDVAGEDSLFVSVHDAVLYTKHARSE